MKSLNTRHPGAVGTTIPLATVLLSCAVTFHGQQDAPILVGVLEQPQCAASHDPKVRALFAKTKSGWVALDTAQNARELIKPNMTWSVASKGLSLGKFETRDPGFNSPYEWTYSRDHLLDVADDKVIPPAPNPGHHFSGWCDSPQRRPLVTVVPGGEADPERWQSKELSTEARKVAVAAYRHRIKNVKLCPKGPDHPVFIQITDRELEVLDSYRDKAGRQLAILRVKSRQASELCDEVEDPAMDSEAFMIEGGHAIFLGSNLELVGAGDFDRDGRTEMLFWFSGYNNDGYVLFSDHFTVMTRYTWNYH